MHNYPYSDDNKRYYTWNYYLKQQFHCKVSKISLDANFTCPNRDGRKGVGGCIFCSERGSGDFASTNHEDLEAQYQEVVLRMKNKWPTFKTIPYFQAYTNTYGPLEKIQNMIEPFLKKEEVVAIALATRADCLEMDVIHYLNEISKQKEIWIELGLQSTFDEITNPLNRQHSYQDFLDCIDLLKNTQIKICVHLINSLPNETREMMIENASKIGQLPIHAVKIHMLHIMKNTKIHQQCLQKPFHLLSLEEYVDVVIEQLMHLPSDMIIQRLTGDSPIDALFEPQWTLNKRVVINEIDKKMARLHICQGQKFERK